MGIEMDREKQALEAYLYVVNTFTTPLTLRETNLIKMSIRRLMDRYDLFDIEDLKRRE